MPIQINRGAQRRLQTQTHVFTHYTAWARARMHTHTYTHTYTHVHTHTHTCTDIYRHTYHQRLAVLFPHHWGSYQDVLTWTTRKHRDNKIITQIVIQHCAVNKLVTLCEEAHVK